MTSIQQSKLLDYLNSLKLDQELTVLRTKDLQYWNYLDSPTWINNLRLVEINAAYLVYWKDQLIFIIIPIVDKGIFKDKDYFVLKDTRDNIMLAGESVNYLLDEINYFDKILTNK